MLLHPDVETLGGFVDAAGDGVDTSPFPPRFLDSGAPTLIYQIRRRIRQLQPRIVHVVDFWPGAIIAARLAGTRRILVTHHTPELRRSDSLVGRALWWLAWRARPEVIYTSETDMRRDARSAIRSHVIYYGIDLRRFQTAKPVLAKSGPIIGSVARLEEQKGLQLLIEAAPGILQAHPTARFVLVGDGTLRGELERQVREAELDDHFLFTGQRDDVPELVASFDVFALPSFFEGLCYAVIEAQAAGVPVVATPVGGIPENVIEGETGILVPPRDARALSDAVKRLLDNPAEGRRLAEEGQRRVLERYPLERMVDQTLRLYGES